MASWGALLAILAHARASSLALSASGAPWTVCDTNPQHMACTPMRPRVDRVTPEMPASEFFGKYVSYRRPILIEGAVSTAPALSEWTDSALVERFGGVELKIEEKREKKSTVDMNGSVGLGRETMAKFVQGFDSNDAYVVSYLPSPMYDDVAIPAVAADGPLAGSMLEANLWMSSGNTSSLLHRDADNVINCVVRGYKHWLLLDPTAAAALSMSSERQAELGGFVVTDPERVDSATKRTLDRFGVSVATLGPGDCLFLPWGYLHQVTTPSPGQRSIAYSMLFPVQHRGACNQSVANQTDAREQSMAPVSDAQHGSAVPLSRQPPLWEYPGHGPMSMGNADPRSVYHSIRTFLRSKPNCPNSNNTGEDQPASAEAGADSEECGFASYDEVVKHAKARAGSAWDDSYEQYVKQEWSNAGFYPAQARRSSSNQYNPCVGMPELVEFLIGLVESSSEADLIPEEKPQLQSIATDWIDAIDSNHDWFVSLRELEAAEHERSSAAAMLPLLSYDPTNSPMYEMYKMSHDQVGDALRSALPALYQSKNKAKQSPVLDAKCADVVREYISSAGGTRLFALAMCHYLEGGADSFQEAVQACQQVQRDEDASLVPLVEGGSHYDIENPSGADAVPGRYADGGGEEGGSAGAEDKEEEEEEEEHPLKSVARDLGLQDDDFEQFVKDHTAACERWEREHEDPKSPMYRAPPPPGYTPKGSKQQSKQQVQSYTEETRRGSSKPRQDHHPACSLDENRVLHLTGARPRARDIVEAFAARRSRSDPALGDAEKIQG